MLLIVNVNQTGLPTGAGVRAGAVPANSTAGSDRMGRPRLYTCVVSTLRISTASTCPPYVPCAWQARPLSACSHKHSRSHPYTVCSIVPPSLCLTRSWPWCLHACRFKSQSQVPWQG